jgi:hypothetical protein
MRLAMLGNGAGEPRLVVVSRDLTRCTDARRIAPTLAAALADWDHTAPALEALARDLELGAVPVERFHEHGARPPLPAAPLLLTEAGGTRDLSAAARLGARDPMPASTATFRPAVTLIAGPTGGDPAVRLVGTLALFDEGAALAFSPVLATTAALGNAWTGGRLLGGPDTEADLGAQLASAAGAVAAGAMLIAPTGPARPANPGRVRLAARDATGHTLFGAIEPEAARAAVA